MRRARTDNIRQAWVNNFLAEARTCPECGNLLPVPNQNQYMTYCSRTCSAKANYRNRSPEVRYHAGKLNGEKHKQIGEQRRAAKEAQFREEHHLCEQCGKHMLQKYASGRFCSYECIQRYAAEWSKNHPVEMAERTERIWSNPVHAVNFRASQQRRIEEGRGAPMMRSDRPSGPERFWNQLLLDNNIRFAYNYVVKHSDLGMKNPKLTWYKLDFYLIDYHVDLEIDGDEHDTPDHIESDKIRDNNLIAGGYKVYRLPWIKEDLTYKQIEELKQYLASLKIIENPTVEPKSITN